MTSGPDQPPREAADESAGPAGWPGAPEHPAGAPVRPVDRGDDDEPELIPQDTPGRSSSTSSARGSEPRDDADATAETAVTPRPVSGSPPEPGERTAPTVAARGAASAPQRPTMPPGPPVAPPPSRPAARPFPTPSPVTQPISVGPTSGAAARKGGRRARLTVKRIDPWSTLKFSFVYSLAGLVVLLVAVIALYAVVDAMGVIASIQSFLRDVGGDKMTAWLSFGRILAIAIVLGAVNVILFTAFATLTAFVYNVCTDLVGGVEVTLAERG
ncbi:MAG TPA: DUF3566 domain-containing protein [Mycobacteriales bacterium]|nr:DUF3566 domain-containing protein [Mycobacteriales bacterium]